MKKLITGSVMALFLITAYPAAAEVGGTITRQAGNPIDTIITSVLGLFTWESSIGSIDFDGNNYSANAGCNNIFSSFSVSGRTIDFGIPASTMMYCDGKMENEAALISVLASSSTFVFRDGKLVVTAGTTSVAFTPTFTAGAGK